MDFLRADDVDYKEQKLKTIFSKAAQLPKGRTGTSQTMFYTSSEGTNVKLDTHQVVMTWRFDLGGGAQSIAKFNQKASNSISLFGDFSSPGLLGNPAIKPGTFSISLRLGGFYPCEDFGLNDGVMGGLSLGCNFTRNGGIEASFDMTRHVSSTVADGHANRSRQDRYPGHTRISMPLV